LKNATSLYQFSPERHRDVRLQPGIDITASLGLNHVKIGLGEISAAAADYPIIFLKDADTGQLQLAALFGLAPQTNSFVIDERWQATYLPLAIVAAPFCRAGPERTLCINELSHQVTTDTGEALFLADGSEAPALANIRAMLDYLDGDLGAADGFVAAMLGINLIRPILITTQFGTGEEELIDGLYTISPPHLRALHASALLDLHGRDLLAPAYTIIQSLAQMNRIQQLHNLESDRPITGLKMEMEAL
jgi:hypothetical protein